MFLEKIKVTIKDTHVFVCNTNGFLKKVFSFFGCHISLPADCFLPGNF